VPAGFPPLSLGFPSLSLISSPAFRLLLCPQNFLSCP
jgi:hypothetical protein